MTNKTYYYHFKHDPSVSINNYAYELIGLGKNADTDEEFVIYKPLYRNDHIGKCDFYIRSKNNFFETIIRKGKKIKRFKKISDKKVIAQLSKF